MTPEKSVQARLESACDMMRRMAEQQRRHIARLEQALADAQAKGQDTERMEQELAAERLDFDTLEQVIAENC